MKDELNSSNWKFAFIGGTTRMGDRTHGDKFSTQPSSSQSRLNSCVPLTQATIGDHLWIVDLQDEEHNPYLLSLGLTPGNQLQLISRTPRGSVLVTCQNNRIGLSREIAHLILVTDISLFLEEKRMNQPTLPMITHLRELPVGSKGYIVGYDKVFSGYTGKLLAMGLIPGTEFTLIRQASHRNPLQIQVRDCLMSLGKPESEALCVEEVENSDN